MRRWTALPLLLSAGCSTAPIADLMDHYYPSDAGPPTAVRVIAAPSVPRPVMPRPPLGALPIADPPEPEIKPGPQPTTEEDVIPAVFRSKAESRDLRPGSLPSDPGLPR